MVIGPLLISLLSGYLLLGGLIALWGRRLDRLAVGLYLVGVHVAVGASLLNLTALLTITFACSALLFLGFWFLAEKAQRWWMVGMAGFQLVSLMTYVVPSYEWERLRQAFLLFHWALAVLHLACLALGVVEVRWARQHTREVSDGAVMDPRNRS